MLGTLAVLGTVVSLSLAVGLLAHRRAARADALDAFAVARNTTGGWTTAATVAASALGGWILFSPVEAGAAFGGVTAVAGYALGAAAPLWLFAVVGPRIRQLMPAGSSVTGYVHARFGRGFYAYVLAVSACYLTVFLAAELTGLAGALSFVAGVPRALTAAVVGGAVLVYAGYGGLVASVASDTLQTVLVLPLLLLTAGGTLFAIGGPAESVARVDAVAPALLAPTNPAGVTFGAYVVLAVLGANVLHQGNWQRVWATESDTTTRRGFALGGFLVVPVVVVAGLFGPLAQGLGVAGDTPSVALFAVVDAVSPGWVTLVVVGLASALVLSSADTAMNALASLVTADLARLRPATDGDTLVTVSRVGAGVVGLLAVVVAAQGYSVLSLFLLADLFGVATFVPVVVGLVDSRLSGRDAMVASVVALAVGMACFPLARPWLPASGLLPAPSFVSAFWGAGLCSAALTALLPRVRDGVGPADARFELSTLERRVSALEAVPDGGRTPDEEADS